MAYRIIMSVCALTILVYVLLITYQVIDIYQCYRHFGDSLGCATDADYEDHVIIYIERPDPAEASAKTISYEEFSKIN